jgi:hypothetical protein
VFVVKAMGLLGVAAASLGLALVSARAPSPHRCPTCSQDVAAAVWFALNQVDCDGNAEQDAECQDELEYVSVAPRVNVAHTVDGGVRVEVAVALKSIGEAHFRCIFDRDGTLMRAEAV